LRALESKRTAAQTLEERLAFANEALRGGDALSARAALRRADTADPAVLRALGRAELALGLFASASERYRRLIVAQPALFAGYIGLCRAQTALQQRDLATQTLETGWRAMQKADSEGRLNFVQEWEQRGNLPRALEAAQQLAQEIPQNPDIALAVGRILYKMERMTEAKQHLEGLVAQYPEHPGIRRYLAAALDSPLLPNRDRSAAEAALIEAAQRDPRDTPSRQRLGELYQEQAHARQAAYVFTQILEVAPEAVPARWQLARAYARLGDMPRSAEQQKIATLLRTREREEAPLRTRRDQRPADPTTRIALARLYRRQERYRLALLEAQSAVALAPDSPESRAELNALYHDLGIPVPVWGTKR
jgi:tetratricopeptide (TPR) repeat protein